MNSTQSRDLPLFRRLAGWAAACLLVSSAWAQNAVDVTVVLDDADVNTGDQTTLRVFGQVNPLYREASDQIFSWYVDVVAENGAIATADYSTLAMPTSDNVAQTSSGGTTEGDNRRGIHNTFLGLANAGLNEPVLLLTVTVKANAEGEAVFRVRAGTTVDNLASDFVVAGSGMNPDPTGGNYGAAKATLKVYPGTLVPPTIQGIGNEPTGKIITFGLQPDQDHTVVYKDSLDPSEPWIPLPGAPHNSGSAVDPSPDSVQRFYAVQTTPRIASAGSKPNPVLRLKK